MDIFSNTALVGVITTCTITWTILSTTSCMFPSVLRNCRIIQLTTPRYDSVVNTYLIEHCGLHPPTSTQYGLVVHSETDFFSSIAFPAVAELGLRVSKLGKSSVTYEVALFEKGVEEVKAICKFIHVFVDRDTGRPALTGMNENIKNGLEKLFSDKSKLWQGARCAWEQWNLDPLRYNVDMRSFDILKVPSNESDIRPSSEVYHNPQRFEIGWSLESFICHARSLYIFFRRSSMFIGP